MKRYTILNAEDFQVLNSLPATLGDLASRLGLSKTALHNRLNSGRLASKVVKFGKTYYSREPATLSEEEWKNDPILIGERISARLPDNLAYLRDILESKEPLDSTETEMVASYLEELNKLVERMRTLTILKLYSRMTGHE